MVTNTITQSYPQNVTQTKQEKEPAFIHNDITVAPIMLSIIITTKIIQCTFQTTAHGALQNLNTHEHQIRNKLEAKKPYRYTRMIKTS